MYKVDRQLLQHVVDYLASKPYSEVYQLIDALQRVETLDGVPDFPERDSKTPPIDRGDHQGE